MSGRSWCGSSRIRSSTAELVYRARPDAADARAVRAVVFATAEFMASFPAPDASGARLVLGPPLQCAQETYPKDRTTNCTYELSYWAWGLRTAQAWRERLGMRRLAEWDNVLARLPRRRSRTASTCSPRGAGHGRTRGGPRTIRRSSAALGVLPGRHRPRRDGPHARRGLGPLELADDLGLGLPDARHDAARLDWPELAIDALLLDTPKNVYRLNGHNHQRPGLTIYLPGNGALLYAVARWRPAGTARPTSAPGFPETDGGWCAGRVCAGPRSTSTRNCGHDRVCARVACGARS